MLRTGPMRTGSRRLLRNCFTTLANTIAGKSISQREVRPGLFLSGVRGWEDNVGIDIEDSRIPGGRHQSLAIVDHSDRRESFDFFLRPASGRELMWVVLCSPEDNKCLRGAIKPGRDRWVLQRFCWKL